MTKSRLNCSCGGSEASTWEHLAEEQETILERQGASSSITNHSCLLSIQAHNAQWVIWCDNILVLGSENTKQVGSDGFQSSVVGGIWDSIYYVKVGLVSVIMAVMMKAALSPSCQDNIIELEVCGWHHLPRSDLMIVIMISTVLIMIIIMTIIKSLRGNRFPVPG